MPPRLESRVVHKTAAYTISPLTDRAGTLFTTRGAAGAVAFTLPLIAQGQYVGYWVEFLNVVDQNLSIVAPAVDTLIALNDLAADSVAFSTAGQKIGARAVAQWDGFQWSVANQSVGHTLTVTT